MPSGRVCGRSGLGLLPIANTSIEWERAGEARPGPAKERVHTRGTIGRMLNWLFSKIDEDKSSGNNEMAILSTLMGIPGSFEVAWTIAVRCIQAEANKATVIGFIQQR